MIGIGFSAVFCVMAKKQLTRVLLIAAIALQLTAMALTNCRTTLLLTGALLGGTVFFVIFKGGWKRFVLGLLAAGVLLAGSFKLSGMLFQWNNDRLLASFSAAQAAAPVEETTPVVEALEEMAPAAEETPEEIVIMEDTGIIIGDNEQRGLLEDLWSFNGRTQIWEAALKAVRNSRPIMLWGTEYSGTMISIYHWFDVVHAHNSWMETLMRMGVLGLLMSLVFTVLSVFSAAKLLLSSKTELWKKIVAMLAMCVMASGFLEPYLFITNVYYHVTDFTFFFLTGYLDFWCNRKKA
jgi:O-antigen ligase